MSSPRDSFQIAPVGPNKHEDGVHVVGAGARGGGGSLSKGRKMFDIGLLGEVHTIGTSVVTPDYTPHTNT